MTFPPTMILNPAAKSEGAGELQQILYKMAGEIRIELTEGVRSATEKAAKAARNGSAVIVAAGGDGTINEVINGIVGTGAVLGIMPVGTANVLARQLNLPIGIEEAWKVIKAGYIRAVDLVQVDYHLDGQPQRRHFVQMAGVGMDAHIIKRVTWKQKKRWGRFSYVFELFRAINDPLPPIKIEMDENPPREGAFALIGNGEFYGGPFRVFNKASMTDGLMDVCLFQSNGFFNLLVYLQAILRGTQASTRGISYYQCRSVGMTSPSEVPIEVDGDFTGYLPAKFAVISQALKILVPAPSGACPPVPWLPP